MWENFSEMTSGLGKHDYEEASVWAKEYQEVLVVPVAEAIVDERTVVVEKLDTSIAGEAVERSLWFDDRTIGTEVVQMQVNIKGKVNQLLEIVFWLQVTSLQAHR